MATSFTTIVGDGSAGPFVVTHNLNTRHVAVNVYRNGDPFDEVIVRCEHTSLNSITLRPDEVWNTGEYRVAVALMATSDTEPPTAPTLSLVSVDSTSIAVSASGATDNVGVVGYNWYLNSAKINSSPTTPASYTFTGLTAGTNYGVTATAVDGEGREGPPSASLPVHTTDVLSDTTAPQPPNLQFASATTSSLTYSFSGATDDVAVTGYTLFNAFTDAPIQTGITSSPVTWGGLNPGASYSAYMKAYDAAGNPSLASNTVTHPTNAIANVTLNVQGGGVRATSGSSAQTSLAVGNGTDRWGLAWASVSHSTSNNPPTFNTVTLSSNLDTGNWTYWGAVSVGQYSSSQQGSILLFYRNDPAIGVHTLTLNIAKSGVTFTSIMLHADAYNNVLSMGTPLTAQRASSSAPLSLTIPVGAGNMAVCGMVGHNSISGLSFTQRYLNGGSVTGTGDYMAVQDVVGTGGNKIFTTSSSQLWGAIAVELQKVA